jgi:hypothetical protein
VVHPSVNIGTQVETAPRPLDIAEGTIVDLIWSSYPSKLYDGVESNILVSICSPS